MNKAMALEESRPREVRPEVSSVYIYILCISAYICHVKKSCLSVYLFFFVGASLETQEKTNTCIYKYI